MSKRQRHVPGITVHPRGTSWSYRLDLEPDPLTGRRRRENRGGFGTEAAGVAPKIVSDRIGHSDMSVAFQVYGHIREALGR